MRRDSPSRSFPKRVLIAVGIVAASVAVLYLMVVLSRVLLVLFAGALVSLLLGGGAKRMSRHTLLPRPAGLAVVVAVIGLVGAGIVATAGPPISAQINDLLAQLPQAVSRLREQLLSQPWADRLLTSQRALQFIPPPAEVLGGVTQAFSVTFGILANGFIILFIGIYGAAAPDDYVRGLVRLAPPERRDRVREVIDALARALRWWMVGRLTMMIAVGVLTAGGLWIAGVPTPLALGLIAALLAFVPYVGPLLAMVPAVLVALLVSLTKVAYVVIVFGVVQTLESYLITPLVQRRAVSLPPAVLLSAQIAAGVLAGATGVLLATPLVVVVIVLLQMLYVEDVLGDSVRVLGQS
jgi:predicted PurR-regulated permease PerM